MHPTDIFSCRTWKGNFLPKIHHRTSLSNKTEGSRCRLTYLWSLNLNINVGGLSSTSPIRRCPISQVMRLRRPTLGPLEPFLRGQYGEHANSNICKPRKCIFHNVVVKLKIFVSSSYVLLCFVQACWRRTRSFSTGLSNIKKSSIVKNWITTITNYCYYPWAYC